MTIIRQPAGITGSKRLGAAAPADDVRALATEPVIDVKAQLREAFADELATIFRHAREQAELDAERDIQKRIADLESAASTEQKALREKLEAEYQEEIRQLGLMMSALRDSAVQHQQTLLPAAVAMAYAALAKMLGEKYVEGSLLEALAQQAMREHGLDGPVKIAVSVSDFEKLSDEGLQDVFLADPGLRQGDCRIRLSGGEVEADVRQQLERIKEVFLLALEEGPREGT